MSDAPITIRHDRDEGAFYAEQDGQQVGEMTYTGSGKSVVIDHTHVLEVAKGRGVGKQLVEAAVDWARTEKVSIRPQCSFARAVFEKTPAFADVLAR